MPVIPLSHEPPPPSPYAPPAAGAAWPVGPPSALPGSANLPGSAIPPGSPIPPLPPTSSGWATPPLPPVPAPPAFGADAAALPGYPTAGDRRGAAPWRALLVVFSAFAVLLGSGFAVFALARPDGASSPEEAVRHLFAALDQEDAAGLLEVLPPSEREVVKQPMLDIVSELQRLGILEDVSVEKVQGGDLQVRDLELSEEPVGSNTDLMAVRVIGGTLVSRTVPDAVPIGPTLRAIIEEDFGEKIEIGDQSATEDLAKDDLRLITVNENGGWHVSLFYSIAEAARDGKGAAPILGNGPSPVGSDTPEGALRGLVDGAVALDLERVIKMLPPDEARVVYDYAPLFLPDVRRAADEAHADGFAATLSRFETTVEGEGDTRRVKVTAFAFEGGTAEDHMKVAWDGDCFHTESTSTYQRYSYEDYDYEDIDPSDPDASKPPTQTSKPETRTESADICPGDPARSTSSDPYQGGGMYTDFGSFNGLAPDAAVVVVQREGRWYVSPIRTLFDSVLTSLRSTTAEQLREWAQKTAKTQKECCRFEPVGEAIEEGPSGTIPRGTPGTALTPAPATVPTTVAPVPRASTTTTTAPPATTTTVPSPPGSRFVPMVSAIS